MLLLYEIIIKNKIRKVLFSFAQFIPVGKGRQPELFVFRSQVDYDYNGKQNWGYRMTVKGFYMIYFGKSLREGTIDTSDWSSLIKNQWFSNKFMYFVYGFQAMLLISSIILGIWYFCNFYLGNYRAL